ncbi:MAG: SEC-C domain-containing protein [Thermomonas sp.]|uniref:SEC-C metal-binding domain-containing protein n=1 Tax=Thermomonas sp. TaxID=1971895 RepID=UPI001E153C1B|nr:SEC-C metal-binding domain-containing protein [Thermomonas sp.]MBZ0086494.1 SEC-C domain-containing protein [Thermomonas sp.]
MQMYHGTKDQFEGIERELRRPLAPLTDEQARKLTPMNAHQRKGYMRNQPCVCGSGAKFKRCCWSKFA